MPRTRKSLSEGPSSPLITEEQNGSGTGVSRDLKQSHVFKTKFSVKLPPALQAQESLFLGNKGGLVKPGPTWAQKFTWAYCKLEKGCLVSYWIWTRIHLSPDGNPTTKICLDYRDKSPTPPPLCLGLLLPNSPVFFLCSSQALLKSQGWLPHFSTTKVCLGPLV